MASNYRVCFYQAVQYSNSYGLLICYVERAFRLFTTYSLYFNMEQNTIISTCKELGCCNACCLRYLGLKNPTAFENPNEFINKYLEKEKKSQSVSNGHSSETSSATVKEEIEGVPAKRLKTDDVCVSCIGVLQEDSWPPCLDMVKEMLDKKKYVCPTFACALSAPITTLLREKAVVTHLTENITHYCASDTTVTPLKEAWKWAMGSALERACGKTLDSGAISPLLITLNLDYPDDAGELDSLRRLGAVPATGRRAPDAGITRRQAERALEDATAETLREAGVLPLKRPTARVKPVSVTATHTPIYIGGRYVKLSRTLPQTPWVLRGERVMESSVQEIIFAPLAALYGMEAAEAEHRLKFMSAGREDVDVRCLGNGRPFAVEVADPNREPTAEELSRVCSEISAGNQVTVSSLAVVTREQLAQLKRGEETKCKTYEVLCIKLPTDDATEVRVTEEDVARAAKWSGELEQRTPLRVLHRRTLLSRKRHVTTLAASAVPDHPQLLALRVRTDAGTYVKEWVHGDLRRTQPSLAEALGAPADILALDVTEVHLEWP